jgi:hypothetical protein
MKLKQMLRDGKTKSGVQVDAHLAHEIAKQITILNEGMSHPETPESIKQMRECVALFLVNHYDSQKKASKAPGRPVPEKVKRAKVTKPHVKRTVTRGQKRRSR